MTYQNEGQMALNYYPCSYGDSRVQFRGPRRNLSDRYIAFIGGAETYGRFVAQPFAAQLEQRLNMPCLNLGAVNAGMCLYLQDPTVLAMAEQASVRVIQVMGAQNMSNRYYSVHPRRNDRFLRASDRLERLYPEVDFTEFHFNGHMLRRLEQVSAERFENVVSELRQAWVARMKHLLTLLKGSSVLLWMADHPPPSKGKAVLGSNPMFVDKEMVDALRPRVSAYLEVVASPEALRHRADGMVFAEFETCVAQEMPGLVHHTEVADKLEGILPDLLEPRP